MTKKKYTPPILIVASFHVERGYAESGGGLVSQMGFLQLLFYQGNPSREIESFNTHSTWTEGTDGFWQ